MRLIEHRPEPATLWVRWSVSTAPQPAGFTYDPGSQTLRAARFEVGGGAVPQRAALREKDDTVWVPAAGSWSASVRGRCRELDVPFVAEVGAAEEAGEGEQKGAVYLAADLLLRDAEVEGDARWGVSAPPGCAAVYLVIPGFTTSDDVWKAAIDGLVARGAGSLTVVSPRIDDAARRALARRCTSEEQHTQFFAALEAPGSAATSRSEIAAAAARAGLAPVPERPLPTGPASLRARRLLAAVLMTRADVDSTLSEVQRLELYQAARMIEQEGVDLVAAHREGNLGVVPWLGEIGRALVAELAGDLEGLELGQLARRWSQGS